MRDCTRTVLLCTKNDPESLMITEIAEALHIPLLISSQEHGARLECEPELQKRIIAVNACATRVVIVEIPGPDEEKRLVQAGYDVVIIDHHTYSDLDRMQMQASLTQFLAFFEISSEELQVHGFNPAIIRGIALIDQGFLWELYRSELTQEEQRCAQEAYFARKCKIHPHTSRIFMHAREAWEMREKRARCVIVRVAHEPGIREAVAWIIAENYPQNPPTSIVVEGDMRISVQEYAEAGQLFAAYGGFLFGNGRCWGMVGKGCSQQVDEIIAKIEK